MSSIEIVFSCLGVLAILATIAIIPEMENFTGEKIKAFFLQDIWPDVVVKEEKESKSHTYYKEKYASLLRTTSQSTTDLSKLRARHLESLDELQEVREDCIRALKRNNELLNEVTRLRRQKGGKVEIKYKTKIEVKGFSDLDIKALIRLCHPDKHDGSAAATRLTSVLLEMRN